MEPNHVAETHKSQIPPSNTDMDPKRQQSAAGQMPFDVLSTIFQFACRDDEEPYRPETLLCICKWWNTVATQDTLLWNEIHLVHPGPIPFQQLVGKANTYTKFSGDSLLDIKLVTPQHAGDYCVAGCRICSRLADELVQLLGPLIGRDECNIARWRTLSLDYQLSMSYSLKIGESQYHVYELLMRYSMPRLKSLEITASIWPSPRIGILVGEGLPEWIESAHQRIAMSLSAQYPAMESLALKGNCLILHPAMQFTNQLKFLHLETNSMALIDSLFQNPTINAVRHLYLCGYESRPSLGEDGPLRLVEKMAELEVVTVAPSLEKQTEQITRSKNRAIRVVVISPAPVYDDDSDEEGNGPAFALFD